MTEKTFELTILMPCLNEAETLRTCILKAKQFIKENNVNAEILIADNGSTDESVDIAKKENVRITYADEKGYGAALIAGSKAARGKYVIMGDADDSYDFLHLMPFVEKLREGYDLVMGNRFIGGIEKDAMRWLHRYIGNPVLSFIGQLFFNSSIGDFHCGLRGYNRESILSLNLHTTGMEYASEMIVLSQINGLRIAEVPTTLKKDGRSKPSHLKSFRDGWRHLKFLFMYAPNWLLLYPGMLMITFGVIIGSYLAIQKFAVNGVTFSIHTLLYCAAFLMIGINMVLMFIMTRIYTANNRFMSVNQNDWTHKVNENIFIFGGGLITLIGIVVTIIAFSKWKGEGFLGLEPEVMMRYVIPAVSALEIGTMSLLSGFLMGIFKIGLK